MADGAARGEHRVHELDRTLPLTARMALFVWVAVATALWHFTIFVPDRFPGGLVGAFACANGGALAAGLISNGLSMPPLAVVSHADALLGAVGGLVGMLAAYAYGTRTGGDRGDGPT